MLVNGALLVGLTAAGSVLAPTAEAGPPKGKTISVCQRCIFKTIQAAIDSADSGSRIEVSRGTYVENLVINGNQSINIVGTSPRRTIIESATVGASVVDAVCTSSAPVKITIANVTISGGSLTSTRAKEVGGAGVSNSGCDLTLFNTVVMGNAVTGSPGELQNAFGGGIANRLNSILTLRDTVVIANTITGPNTVALGAGLYNDGTLHVIDSQFTMNRATPSASATFFRGQGGGVFTTIGSTIIKDSSVTDNVVAGAGGGVSAGGGIVTTKGSTQVLGSNIARNSASNGGGVYMQGTVLLDGSSVRRNTANLKGGGVFVTGTANELGAGTLNIKESVVNRNVADGTTIGSGGGIFVETGGVVNATNATIRANSPDNCAGC
jgi:hypothetical protein